MGSYAYDYLNDSLLLDKSLITQLYKGVSDVELERELSRYREYCIGISSQVKEDIKGENGITSCLATDSMSTINNLKRGALYLEKVVVKDPIFECTDFSCETSENLKRFLGGQEAPRIDRSKLSNAAMRLIELRPLVAGGYVKLYPVSYELEVKPKIIPLINSKNLYEDILPNKILERYRNEAIVRNIVEDNGQLLVSHQLSLGRHIIVFFKGLEHGFRQGFMLTTPEVSSVNEKKRTVILEISKEHSSPSQKEFQTWVTQSINQTAGNHYFELNKRLVLANHLGCMFCTEHPFEHELLNMNVGPASIQENTLNCTLQMDVPFLENVSSADLMSIRNNEIGAFQSFRYELEKGVREARHESDPNRISAIIEDTRHELFEVQMNQIEPQVRHIRKTHFAEAAVALAGLGLSVVTGGSSLLASALAAAHGIKSQSDYEAKLTANPCHFLWKVKQKAKN